MIIEDKSSEIDLNIKMGLVYSKSKSTFRVFSPPNNNLKLRIYDKADSIIGRDYLMKKNSNGIFEIDVEGDLDGKFYTYITDDYSEVTDPYSFASSINSQKSAIVDLESTNPIGWIGHERPSTKPEEAIIYEVHVKDFTISETSGVTNKGKFLGFIESGRNYKGVSTALNHLIELGITHVHFMPIYDYLTVNEREEFFHINENYNWGYDPEFYNVPEGSYSTKPDNPKSRIFELKSMIKKLHENGISVIMDVVYNHLFRGENSNFESLNPGYYLRRKKNFRPSNGAGVGTEMDTQRPMFRKFIIDSIRYWMEEYNIDGFRFDLMGLIDIDTMEEVTKVAKSINKNVLIYGEPWCGGTTTLSYSKMTLKGRQYNKGFAVFNDTFRDCIKGDNNGVGLGFAMGDFNKKICVETGIAGSIDFDSLHSGFTYQPIESINYTNSHDDLILTDKIDFAMRNSSLETRTAVNKLAHSIVFLSFGIPFIHAGNEFLRSKNGISNTYNGPTSINAIDWALKIRNKEFYEYFRDLIGIRKQIKAFSEYDNKLICENLYFLDFHTKPTIGYILKSEERYYLIFHNVASRDIDVSLYEIVDDINRKFKKYYTKEKFEIKNIFNKFGMQDTVLDDSFSKIKVQGISTEVYRLKTKK